MRPRLHPIVRALVLAWLAHTLLFLLVPWLWQPAAATARALVHFTPEQLDVGRAYVTPLRLLRAAATVLSIGSLLVLLLTPLGGRLADALLRLSRGRVALAAAAMTAALSTIQIVLDLPFAIARHHHRAIHGMTTQPLGSFLGELAIAAALVLGVGSAITLIASWLIARAPRRGWIAVAATVVAVEVLLTAILPVVIAPLFNRFEPLAQSRWAADEPALRALATHAGMAPTAPILVADASRQGVEANAYVAGLLGSERIVLYDTLLARHTAAMVRNTLAHELGHWQLHHVRTFVLWLAAVTVLGCAALWWLLGASIGRGRLAPPDRHGPRAVLLVAAILVAVEALSSAPLAALSRRQETAADDFGLQLTGAICPFVEDEKLALLNARGDAVPHPVRQLLASHPSSVERIERACATVSPAPPCCHHPGL